MRHSLLFCLLMLSACGFETPESSYDSLAEVTSLGLLEKGWIPKWLPSNAQHIQEIHNIDTNASALAFDIPDGGTWLLPEHCKPIAVKDAFPNELRRSWWPSDAALAASYRLYQCHTDASTHATFAGISAQHQRGIHWRTHEP